MSHIQFRCFPNNILYVREFCAFFLQLTSLRLATTCKVFAWCTGCCNSKLHIYIAQHKCKYPIQSRGVKSEDLSTESSEFRCHRDEREDVEEPFHRFFSSVQRLVQRLLCQVELIYRTEYAATYTCSLHGPTLNVSTENLSPLVIPF